MRHLEIIENFSKLNSVLNRIAVTDEKGKPVELAKAFTSVLATLQLAHKHAGTCWFIGNGGSAAISSHMAIDYSKNGNIRAGAFNDIALLTCLSNDYSYADVFSKALEQRATADDVVIAISSSGESQNIINAVEYANSQRLETITLSAFAPDNRLRKLGRINFYVPTGAYGMAEIAHLAILHTLLDLAMKEEK